MGHFCLTKKKKKKMKKKGAIFVSPSSAPPPPFPGLRGRGPAITWGSEI
jgi:hypothetical protein